MNTGRSLDWIWPFADIAPADPRDPAGASLCFAGDYYVAPSSQVRSGSEILDPALLNCFQQSGLAVANLEAPITSSATQALKGFAPRLRQSSQAAAILRSAGFGAACVANNHIMDYGAAGLQQTFAACEAAAVRTFGAGSDTVRARAPLIHRLPNGHEVVLFSFCEREFGVSGTSEPGAAWLTSPAAERAIEAAKRTGATVIVCAHGGNEDVAIPSLQRQLQLRGLVDAGADFVIGHHPHVSQGWERWQQGYIFYSLGNFYFDPVTSRDIPARNWGFAVKLWFHETGIRHIGVLPFRRQSGRVVPLPADAGAGEYLNQVSAVLTRPDFDEYWRSLAVTLLVSKYVPDTQRLFRWETLFRRRRSDLPKDIVQSLRVLLTTSNDGHAEPSSLRSNYGLMLLNLIRCESHRWTLETAVSALASGSEEQDPAIHSWLANTAERLTALGLCHT